MNLHLNNFSKSEFGVMIVSSEMKDFDSYYQELTSNFVIPVIGFRISIVIRPL